MAQAYARPLCSGRGRPAPRNRRREAAHTPPRRAARHRGRPCSGRAAAPGLSGPMGAHVEEGCTPAPAAARGRRVVQQDVAGIYVKRTEREPGSPLLTDQSASHSSATVCALDRPGAGRWSMNRWATSRAAQNSCLRAANHAGRRRSSGAAAPGSCAKAASSRRRPRPAAATGARRAVAERRWLQSSSVAPAHHLGD